MTASYWIEKGVEYVAFLGLLELLMGLMMFFAYQDKILCTGQTIQRGEYIDKRFMTFWGHWGMRSDIFIYSPFIAWMTVQYYGTWSGADLVLALVISLIVSGIMVNVWRLSSYEVEDPFYLRGKLTAVGHLHFTYMVLTLWMTIMFFFYTPSPSPHLVTWASLIVGFHVLVGIIQPHYAVWRKVSHAVALQVLIVWCLIIFRWIQLTQR